MKKLKYQRTLQAKITEWLFQGKVIILYGPRQVGKTTLANEIISGQSGALYLNCERQQVWELLNSGNQDRIRQYLGDAKIVVFDEAQKIPQIGSLLKLLIDTYPEIQYLATGSSSFDLSNALSEPLTGRNVKFIMYPVSLIELSPHFNRFQKDEMLENLLLFGSYPDIIDRPESQKRKLLDELTSDYLFRDVLRFENIRRSDILVNLLKAIALQTGNEVSMRELSNLLKVAVETVQRYLLLLEQSFVLFSLPSFSRNLRNEISKGRKYYFYDLGIRNNLLQNFTPLSSRNDTGQLWENFCIIERIKKNQAKDRRVNMYFWRTYQQQEIDLIEEHEGILDTFEFKWKSRPGQKIPSGFRNAYPQSTYQIIDRENYHNFLT
ncbi:MAG: ATP-binding protein [Lentimicrobium sp.]|uniref:ATP-binding protein n=1 Tax=Lentimicrobium sp. TaxID=2034841 RepID=UPI0025E849FE|nr:ATP-binding protein [Lentimicrobium sp.]MCO5257229.1 ATP-binding protein [Lentimicrobium sp.]MCO5262066.1 ATP-binding protein [Lentimicrobium sp.]HPF63669.1 ATP-binding protein [Lentimicrobium sp.]HRW68497.1 ATP-binding protein [Lentimicrobium sp.]